MPHTTTCEITFDDNPDRVYYGGQTVYGRIQLILGKEKTIRGNYESFDANLFIVLSIFHWFGFFHCLFAQPFY